MFRKNHQADNSFPGIDLKDSMFGYEVMTFCDERESENAKHKIVILNITHDYKRTKTNWSPLYLMFHIQGMFFATIAKCFLVPAMMVTLLFIEGTQRSINADQKEIDELTEDVLNNTITIFLAHIAVIIFNKGHSPEPTGGERAVLGNTIFLCVATFFAYFFEPMRLPVLFRVYSLLDWIGILSYLACIQFIKECKLARTEGL